MDPGSRALTVLVHRPGRMMAIGAGAMLLVAGGLLFALQFGEGWGRGWWNLLLMVPAVVGFVALMRTGTTRCEVRLHASQLHVRSVDSSQLLGRTRELACPWTAVRAVTWVGSKEDELRLDFSTSPRALVFSGSRRDLERLRQAAMQTVPVA